MSTIKLTAYKEDEAERLAIELGLRDTILETRERMIAGHPTKRGHTQALTRVRGPRTFYLLIFVVQFTSPVSHTWDAMKAEHEHEVGNTDAENMCQYYLNEMAERLGHGASVTETILTDVQRPVNRLKA